MANLFLKYRFRRTGLELWIFQQNAICDPFAPSYTHAILRLNVP